MVMTVALGVAGGRSSVRGCVGMVVGADVCVCVDEGVRVGVWVWVGL